jgi:hypothetical protein
MVKESISLHGNEEAERMQQGTRTRCNTQGHIPSDPARTHLLKFPAPSKIVLLDEDLGFKTWTYEDISFLNHSIAIKIYICFTINEVQWTHGRMLLQSFHVTKNALSQRPVYPDLLWFPLFLWPCSLTFPLIFWDIFIILQKLSFSSSYLNLIIILNKEKKS